MIQLHRLEGFYWVAKTGGYARAARAFPYPISQPGVHQQVAKLEDDLGLVLFERVAKDAMRLTAAGAHLLAFCAPFFEQLPAVVRSLRASEFGGTLRIDAPALILGTLLPDWIRRIQDAAAQVRVDVEEIQTPDFSRLESGAADLIVDYLDVAPSGLSARRVATSYAFLVVGERLARGKRKRLSVEALRDEPFVSYHPNLRQYAVQMEAVASRIGAPRRSLSASSVDAILALVKADLGYSVVPWLDRRGPRREGIVAIRQKGPGTEFPIHAVWREAAWPHPLLDVALKTAPLGT